MKLLLSVSLQEPLSVSLQELPNDANLNINGAVYFRDTGKRARHESTYILKTPTAARHESTYILKTPTAVRFSPSLHTLKLHEL